MEFNIGDVVRIRQDLNMEAIYNNLCVIFPMMQMCKQNKEWVITEKTISFGNYRYRLEGQEAYEDGTFLWASDMLEPAGNEIVISQSELADFLGI